VENQVLGWRLCGIRGATTVSDNGSATVEAAVVELLTTMQARNQFVPSEISSAIFTTTPDLDTIFPSQVARKHLSGWEHVPLLDLAQLPVHGSLPSCIRVLLQVNCEKAQTEIHHVYLRSAQNLRPDLL
jgi:chorismate mutase